VPANSRFNVPVGSHFPAAAGKGFGALIESIDATPVPIVVERATYSDAGGVIWAAGTDALGTPIPWRKGVSSPRMIEPQGHTRWVRVSHWLGAASLLVLAVTGYLILMVHPRLYWGEVGNDLTPALIELPISRNHQHGGWAAPKPFFARAGAPVSASRTFEIFNQNGWGRSLHFLAAWIAVLTGVAYVLAGVSSGHLRRRVLPPASQIAPGHIWADVVRHLRRQVPRATGGPDYGLLQKLAYSFVVFGALPLAVVTGLAMSPRVTAAVPALGGLFGGFQSARTIHFVAFVVLTLFALAHVVMVATTGFTRHMRGMTIGERR
jgi:thiosulfate reductase cytochrome b subunit